MADNQGRRPHIDDSRIESLASRAQENSWGNSSLDEAIRQKFDGVTGSNLDAIRQTVREKMKKMFG